MGGKKAGRSDKLPRCYLDIPAGAVIAALIATFGVNRNQFNIAESAQRYRTGISLVGVSVDSAG
jgi:hypothetical protein